MKSFKMLLMAALTIASVSLFAQTKPAAKDSIHKSAKAVAVKKYTCTMDPDVITDKPGKCPKCGMELVPLVEKKAKKKMSSDMPMHM